MSFQQEYCNNLEPTDIYMFTLADHMFNHSFFSINILFYEDDRLIFFVAYNI